MTNDGNYGRPEYNPGPPPWAGQQQTPPPQQAPKKSNTLKIVLIVLGVLLALCGGATVFTLAGAGKAIETVDKEIKKEAVTRTADVKITSCALGAGGMFIEVKYDIVNSSDTTQTYILSFDILSGKTRVGEANGIESDVAPGVTVKGTAMGTVQEGSKDLECQIRSA